VSSLFADDPTDCSIALLVRGLITVLTDEFDEHLPEADDELRAHFWKHVAEGATANLVEYRPDLVTPTRVPGVFAIGLTPPAEIPQ
jgi:hypothetical protein